MNSPVAITGMGAVTPLGVGSTALHDRAVAGICGLADGVGRCVAFDPLAVLTRKQVHRTDRFAQFALVAADEAVRQAGWQGGVPYEADRVMTIVGSAVGGILTIEAKLAELRENGPEFVSGLSSLMANAAAAQIAIAYGLRGEAYCIASACASGAQAIGAGLRAIQRDQADAVIVGGAEASISEFVCSAFLNAGAMSVSGKSVPFDRDRDGFLMGEGAGILVLEAEERARRRGAEVLGLLHGFGSTCDAHHVTAPDESGVAARAAVRLALTEAGLAPDEIDYINAHGTGTQLNDRLEVAALRGVFDDALERIPISSTKSSVGHLVGAAGAVEAVATIAALRAKVVPPTVGLATPDEELGPLRHVVHGLPLELPGRRRGRAISTSFGFGGHNAVLTFSAPGERG